MVGICGEQTTVVKKRAGTLERFWHACLHGVPETKSSMNKFFNIYI
jgi:hypothetical protein